MNRDTETRLSARQLIRSLKHYQLNELAMLLAAIHEEDTAHSIGSSSDALDATMMPRAS